MDTIYLVYVVLVRTQIYLSSHSSHIFQGSPCSFKVYSHQEIRFSISKKYQTDYRIISIQYSVRILMFPKWRKKITLNLKTTYRRLCHLESVNFSEKYFLLGYHYWSYSGQCQCHFLYIWENGSLILKWLHIVGSICMGEKSWTHSAFWFW